MRTPSERQLAVFRERQSGATLGALGEKFGIQKERVRQIFQRVSKWVEENPGGVPSDPFLRLSTRVQNTLRHHGVTTWAEARVAREMGLMEKWSLVGGATLREIDEMMEKCP